MQMNQSNNRGSRRWAGAAWLLAASASLWLTGCGSKSDAPGQPARKTVIQNTGSDTIVNLAQAWAEEYAKQEASVSVEVSGGGSGTGIAALINGTVDIANCSRKMEPEEIQKAKANTGKEPREYMVGYDALAVYVSKENPLEEITLEQLAQIYGEGGKTAKWSELGVKMPGNTPDEIIRVSRQSNSGTYQYFREAILGKGKDFKLGSRDLHGSKDVVELISKTPGAIGYSGMGYATAGVKMLKVSARAGQPAMAPTAENALSGAYPIARSLLCYTLGAPEGELKKYLDWMMGDAGQKSVAICGYVPNPPSQHTK